MAQSPSHLQQLTPEQAAEVRTELNSILTSDSFSGSNRCRDFLEFVVTRAIAGDRDNLTERFIGVELFGRSVDYETATDAIVRVRANDVRRRLAQYYSGRQPASKVRIDLVAGAYIPEFQWQEEENRADAAAPASLSTAAPVTPASTLEVPAAPFGFRNPKTRWLWIGAIAVCGLIAVVAIAFAARPRTSNFDRFWRPVLQASSSPVIVLPTTDTLQLALGSDKNYTDIKPGQAVSFAAGEIYPYHNWHVSLPVFQGTMSVALALQRKGQTPLVRIGTDLKRDEMRGHPIIAIGSFSNPWTQENVSGLRFTFDRGASDKERPHIRDARNPQRSWSLTTVFPQSQTKDYAIITRTFDPETHEPFVSLAGLHSFGNQIAGEFLAQESSWDALASRAPSGWENMNLQIVLEADVIGTTPSSPRIVDVYFWK